LKKRGQKRRAFAKSSGGLGFATAVFVGFIKDESIR
jgi:hypothetical protein